MKKTIVCICLLLVVFTSNAQKNLEKASAETCDCLNNAKPADNISQEEYQKLLTNCLAVPIVNYYEKICKEIKVAADNSQDSYEAVGAKIGAKLLDNCPVFLKLALAAENSKALPPQSDSIVEQAVVTGTSSGTIKSIDTKDFYYISIENTSGNKETFIWLRYFKGSTAFENNPTAQVGKKATIKYREIRCFSPALGDYAIKKEIIAIELQD